MEAFYKQYDKPVVPISERTFRFGKYKGKTYEEVYDTDKGYVCFVMKNLDDEKNKPLKLYFQKRIEEDYSQ